MSGRGELLGFPKTERPIYFTFQTRTMLFQVYMLAFQVQDRKNCDEAY